MAPLLTQRIINMRDFAVNLYYKIDMLRHSWRERLFADLAARATRKFPKVAYWITLTVGARNIQDDEVVFEVPFMDVLHRQFIQTDAVSQDA